MNDMKCTSEGGLYTSQAVKTYLRFPTQLQPAVDWLVCQAEAVHIKTVCLGSCVICVYHIAAAPLVVDVGLMGNLILLNTSPGIVEQVVTHFCIQESLLFGKIVLVFYVAEKILNTWSLKIQKMVL